MATAADYGILVNQKNIKLARKYFVEMTKLLGIQVQYQYPLENKDYNTRGELVTSYSEPITVGCILEDHPKASTTKKLGWNSELLEDALIISLPYDLEHLQVGCLISIPSGFDNAEPRLFRIVQMSAIMVYPASITCRLVPEMPNITGREEVVSFNNSNFNLLVVD